MIFRKRQGIKGGLYTFLILITVLLLAACNGAEDTAEPTQASAPLEVPTEVSGLSGQIQIAGSTSVQPLAEDLAEAFMALNPDVVIEIQGGGSSVGVTSAGEGTVDIGEASRAIKDSEFETFPNLQVYVIALDGIAMVTHPEVELATLSLEQVKDIFAGDITNFSEVGGPDAEIVVVSREEGSGTRGAFEEMVMEAGEEKVISEDAILQQSNGQVRTTVSTTPNTIGYISFGFLDESTNPVPIDGVEPSVANVKNGTYPIKRPFNMLTNGAPGPLVKAFIDFVLGSDGQAIVAEDYISIEGGMEEPPPPAGLSGQIQIAGSTSVQPLAEDLAEAFMALNPDLVIEIQGGGSSVGVTSAGEGTVDIGEASRAIKGSEFETFPNLQVFVIALDGIAIVTHPEVELATLSLEQVKDIFAGDITNFSEVGGPDAEIIVVSREEGSGTRGAFEEMVMEAGEEKVISEDAILQQSNGQVRTTVSTTPNSIGFISFGFLDESTNPVPIDGVLPLVINVKAGSYPIFRPFNMLTNGEPGELAKAFIDWVLGADGQAIVAEDYIPVTYSPPTGLSGQLQIAGSTSVQPLAEDLAEAFMALNPDVVIEIQGGGSSVGVTSAGEGTVDIGEASRAIKGSEFETFPNLQVYVIAIDGIAIVTHPEVELATLSLEQVKDIFAGDITNFSEVGGPDAEIVVVSREEGSGTRGAFEEMVMEAGEEKVITEDAILQQSNGQVRTTVSTTPNTIGYISFGFLDESTHPVPIDGVEPTVDNVKNGTYPIFRPFNMLTNGAPGELAEAFIGYVISDVGQAIVAEDYIPVK